MSAILASYSKLMRTSPSKLLLGRQCRLMTKPSSTRTKEAPLQQAASPLSSPQRTTPFAIAQLRVVQALIITPFSLAALTALIFFSLT